MNLVDISVTLLDLPYAVTRRLTVPQDIRLTDLHSVLQAAMGWDNSHMYDFTCGRSLRWFDSAEIYEDEGHRALKTATLANVLAEMGRKKSFTYTYDMGDSWEHDLRPANPRPATADEAIIALHSATGACPPDDSGGAPGFGYMLECLADPASDEHAEYAEWLGTAQFETAADVPVLIQKVASLAKRLAKRYRD